MNSKQLTLDYLKQVNIMQLATSVGDQPWACNLHFYNDDELNFYWISTLDRNHSKHIEQNDKVSVAVLVHENTAEEPYVIGVSVTGTAELIGENIDEAIGNGYVVKLNKESSFLADIASGKNPHKFYKLNPTKVVLFDNKDYPDSPRQEVELS